MNTSGVSLAKKYPLTAAVVSLATAGLLGMPAAAAAAQVVANGSFEAPNLAPGTFQYRPSASGSTFESNSGVASNGSIFLFAPAPDGNQVAFLQSAPSGTGIFSLSVSGLITGSSYTASFFSARRPSVNGTYGVNPFTVSFDGMALGLFTPASDLFTAFHTASFVAGGTTGILQFAGTPVVTGDNSSAIDLVNVNPLVVAAVPEPATWAMMIGGLGIVGGAMRRRQRTTVSVA